MNRDSYAIGYRCLESLTNLCPSMLEDDLLFELNPVSIFYPRNDSQPKRTLKDARRTFRCHRREWQKSHTCMALKHHLATTNFSVCITKIVCFGLGPLRQLNERGLTRSHMQHAAVETMAEVLKEKSGYNIPCYARKDPPGSNLFPILECFMSFETFLLSKHVSIRESFFRTRNFVHMKEC
jgi:hypothetical protein